MNKGLYFQGPAFSTLFSGSFLRQRTIFEFTVGWPSASGTLIALKRSRRMSMLVLHAPPICAKISAKAVWRVRMSRPRNDPGQSRVLAQSPLFRNRGKRVFHYSCMGCRPGSPTLKMRIESPHGSVGSVRDWSGVLLVLMW